MLDRNIGRALLEVCYWIAFRVHRLGDQLVGGEDSALRVVHKAPLNFHPAIEVASAGRLRERPQAQALDPLHAVLQLRLGAAGAAFTHNSFVLGTESLAELHGTAPAHVEQEHQQYRYSRHGDQSNNEPRIHSFSLLLGFRSSKPTTGLPGTPFRVTPPSAGRSPVAGSAQLMQPPTVDG